MLAPTVVTVPVAGGVRSNMHTCLISTAVTTTTTTATVKTPFAIISKTTTTTPQSSISTQTKQVGVEDGAGVARTGVAEIAAATATTAKVPSTTTNQL